MMAGLAEVVQPAHARTNRAHTPSSVCPGPGWVNIYQLEDGGVQRDADAVVPER